MLAKRLNPILNESVAWFEKLGWKEDWDWGDPPTFGAACSGNVRFFLRENGQGGRGKREAKFTFGAEGDDYADLGVWDIDLSGYVDAVHRHCVAAGG
jgi:hypothetical protein